MWACPSGHDISVPGAGAGTRARGTLAHFAAIGRLPLLMLVVQGLEDEPWEAS